MKRPERLEEIIVREYFNDSNKKEYAMYYVSPKLTEIPNNKIIIYPLEDKPIEIISENQIENYDKSGFFRGRKLTDVQKSAAVFNFRYMLLIYGSPSMRKILEELMEQNKTIDWAKYENQVYIYQLGVHWRYFTRVLNLFQDLSMIREPFLPKNYLIKTKLPGNFYHVDLTHYPFFESKKPSLKFEKLEAAYA